MNEKVTISKELAEAIEAVKKIDCSVPGLVDIVLNPEEYPNKLFEYNVHNEAWLLNQAINDGNASDILNAIINGYKTERTPNEELREYYESNRDRLRHPSRYSSSESILQLGRNQGVNRTLSILGITVAGINDNKTKEGE